mmetsp:Transcript_6656/g.15668  ORF Transcript_6656/g.15668 Transcript_6656/m.15668 type:complete len:95 (+) Transcript_6656:601-885(+)
MHRGERLVMSPRRALSKASNAEAVKKKASSLGKSVSYQGMLIPSPEGAPSKASNMEDVKKKASSRGKSTSYQGMLIPFWDAGRATVDHFGLPSW